MTWETYLQIQARLLDNYAEYDRNKSRGVPRAGAAMLAGLVCCGECGHKMVVQYKGRTRYLCNYLRQQYHVPVCQNLPSDPIDAAVIAAFFEALRPIELDAYAQAVLTENQEMAQVAKAHQQHLARLEYEAALAERQFNRVDPDNRLVASELERRWESALALLKQTQQDYAQLQTEVNTTKVEVLSEAVKAAFGQVCQQLPQLWQSGVVSDVHKKALLRSLIEKVVVKKTNAEKLLIRVVWKGGAVSELAVAKTVGSMKELEKGEEMTNLIVEWSQAGMGDKEIAQRLSELGYRSPMSPDSVLTNTIRVECLKHGIFLVRHQSHPRHIVGKLTISELAKQLEIEVHWVYDRINNGTIRIMKNERGMYVFPDQPETLQAFRELREGKLKHLDYREGHQHE